MTIEVNGQTIALDEEGYLVNKADWNYDVAAKLAELEHIQMTETHWGLVEAARQFYMENERHPTENELFLLLGKHLKEEPHEARKDINDFLYMLFPLGPEKQLTKIAGLPKYYTLAQ